VDASKLMVYVLNGLGIIRKLGLRRRDAIGLLMLNLISGLFEGVGAAMLLPLMELIVAAGDVAAVSDDIPFWGMVTGLFKALDVPLSLTTLTIAVTATLLAQAWFACLHKIYKAWVRHGLLRNLRNRIFRHCLAITLERYERMNLGELLNSQLIEAERAVRTMILTLVLISGAIMIAMYLGLMFTVSVPMTAAIIVIFGAEAFVLPCILKRIRQEGFVLTTANHKYTSHLIGRLNFLRHIRLTGMRDIEFAAGKSFATRQANSSIQLVRLTAMGVSVVELLIIVSAFTLFYIGHKWFELTLPALLISLGMVFRLATLTKDWTGKFQKLLGQQGGFFWTERLLDDLSEAREELGGSELFPGIKQNIKFESVSFRYAARLDIEALNDVTLEIPAGGFTAIVGPSGAGKSTLVDLLPRLRQPTQGRITIDGRDIATFELLSLRRGIAYVPQEPQLFNVSVGDHIRYGNDSPAAGSADAVKAAATLAGAAEFIEALPQGYDTMLGEGGIELSGGQRQRLDLARAVMRGAPVLILDEPTSRLDAEAEHVVKEALQRIRALGTTVIVVAHRFTTVAAADQIHVFENGRLTASGDHESLTRQGGWYARAFRQQSFLDVTTDAVQSVNA